jgi:hypothetical protein
MYFAYKFWGARFALGCMKVDILISRTIPYMFLLVQYGICACFFKQRILMCGETVERAIPVPSFTIESLLF